MHTTWEKIIHDFGTIYGHDIINEIQSKTKVSILKPEYTEDVQLNTQTVLGTTQHP